MDPPRTRYVLTKGLQRTLHHQFFLKCNIIDGSPTELLGCVVEG